MKFGRVAGPEPKIISLLRTLRARNDVKPDVIEHAFAELALARLQKAGAVLLALVYSLSQALDSEQAGDVASVALDLIEAGDPRPRCGRA